MRHTPPASDGRDGRNLHPRWREARPNGNRRSSLSDDRLARTHAVRTRALAARNTDCRSAQRDHRHRATERRASSDCSGSPGYPAIDDAAARDYPRRSRTPRPERSVRVPRGGTAPRRCCRLLPRRLATRASSRRSGRRRCEQPSRRRRSLPGIRSRSRQVAGSLWRAGCAWHSRRSGTAQISGIRQRQQPRSDERVLDSLACVGNVSLLP